jgi:hypothetical protein
LGWNTWNGEAKAAVVAAILTGIVTGGTAGAVPLFLDGQQAERTLEQVRRENKEASYGAFLDAAHSYYLALDELGVVMEPTERSSDGSTTFEPVPPLIKLPTSTEIDQKFTNAGNAWRSFDAERARVARDVSQESIGEFNRVVQNLPSLEALTPEAAGSISNSDSKEIKTINARDFRTAYYQFIDRFRVEARGDDTLWTPEEP